MSRWVVVIAVVLAVGLAGSGNALAFPGSGTQEDPWRIELLADFDEFAADPNYWSGFTRLETDVNLAGRTYYTSVIAPDTDNSDYDFDGTGFTGVFEGNDHKIIGLTINGGADNDFLGLFGYIGEDGQVSNLGIRGGFVSGDVFVGGLVGFNSGTVSNCYSTTDVITYGDVVGGLVGSNSGTVSNCYSTGSVSGDLTVGGLVGGNSDGSISNCYSTGDVTGFLNDGGLVGWNSGSVSNCYSNVSVRGYERVGGLVGLNSGSVSNCYSTGDVNGIRDVGGLVGTNGGSISNCYSAGDVNGNAFVAGLVGTNWGSISNCYSAGDVNGDSYVGGIVGANGCGGEPGYPGGTITNCYSTGNVSGSMGVGALVGENGVGGGWPSGSCSRSGQISDSYSAGSVQGTSNVGGLVGYLEYGGIERSFWDVETSGEPNMCGSQTEYATGCDPNCGKTTGEMQTKSTFNEADWDFVDIWLINEGATYPVLRQEIRSDLNGSGGVDMLDFAVFADHWLEGY